MADSNDTSQITSPRYSAQGLIIFATTLLARSGLSHERARTVAEILVEADLMDHTTHGLQLLAPYLKELETGAMMKDGEPTVIADRGSAITWNGNYLPGPWLVVKAIDLACERIQEHPVVTIAIQRSHHIACLAAYPERVTKKGLFLLLTCSDPRAKAVAPYGGTRPLYTPNPLAAGIPTQSDPIILDVSLSTTAWGVVSRSRQEGKQLPHPWLLDGEGNPTHDPNVVSAEPPGSILPLGGVDLGYKGFALGLLVEALTSALAGYGRIEDEHQWGSSVFLQVIDPDAFGGRDYFLRETQWLASASINNPTRPGDPPVRVPGHRALQRRSYQLEHGVSLYPSIMPALKPWAERLDVALPSPISPAEHN